LTGGPAECPCCGAEPESVGFLCEAGRPIRYRQYECRSCGFQFTHPLPSPGEIDAYYSSESYYRDDGESVSGDYRDYDSQIVYTVDFCRDWLKKIGCRDGARLLDVGCALGRYMQMASADLGFSCEGVEISDFARDFVAKNNPGRFRLYKTVAEMPVQERPFDVILMFDVIEHVNSPWELLWPLFQRGCVGQETKLLVTTPNAASCSAEEDPASWRYRYPPAHLSFCPPRTFAYVAKKLMFAKCDVNGHSVLEGNFDYRAAIADSYRFFDGLCCEFSGSRLGRVATGRSESWEAFSRSVEYANTANEFNATLSLPIHNANNDFFLIENISKRLAVTEEQLREAKREASSCAAELAEARERRVKLEADFKSRMEIRDFAIRSINGELVSCKGEDSRLRERCGSLEGEKAMLAAEVDSARKELASAMEVRANLERDLAAKDGRISDLEKYGVHYETLYKNLLAEFGRRTDELGSLRIAYAVAVANSRRMAAMCDDLRGRCDMLSCSVLRRALERMRRTPGAMAGFAHRKWAKFVGKAHRIGFVGAARLAAVKVLGRVLGHGQ